MLLIIYNPGVGHEILGVLMKTLVSQKPDNVTFGGTICTHLNDGGKSPDFAMYSDDDAETQEESFDGGDGKEATLAYPTVVIEVGYSESMRDLAEDCARWISCSLGRVFLAVGIDVKYTFRKNSNGQTVAGSRQLVGINCYTWAMDHIVAHDALPAGEKLDVLERNDDQTTGPATRYYCFSYLGKQLYCYHSHNRHKYQVCSSVALPCGSDAASCYDTGVSI